MIEVIYLDNNATTRPCQEALDVMLPLLTESYGNPSSVHRFGQRARQAIDTARAQLAELVGCVDSELMFTGGGTEAINAAMRSLFTTRAPRKRIITSTVEHSATRAVCRQLALEGAEIVEVPVDSLGHLDMDHLQSHLNADTALVTLLYANNETGVVWDVAAVGELCRRHGVPLHVDATQAVGKIETDVRQIGADAMSFASHKFHGPKGVGALYFRKGMRFRPLLVGGPQERERRGGTENVAGIAGMGAAAVAAKNALPLMQAHVATLRDQLERRILTAIPETSVLGDREQRLPNTTNIAFHRIEAEAILLLLSEQGICASAGAACSSGSLEASHVLRGMHIEPVRSHGAIRFSLSRFTTAREIDRTLDVLPKVIGRLRQVLPVG